MAFAWPNRSTWSAVLTLTIDGFRGDPGRVVGDLGAHHLDPLVAVDPVEQLRGAEQERRRDRDVAVEGTGPLEREHAVGEHLGPDPQPAPTGQTVQGRVRHGADAGLQGRPVADPLGDQAADRRRVSSTGDSGACGMRLVGLDEQVDRSSVEHGVAVGPRACRRLACAMTRPPLARAASTAAGSTLTSAPSDTCRRVAGWCAAPPRPAAGWSGTAWGPCDSRDGT